MKIKIFLSVTIALALAHPIAVQSQPSWFEKIRSIGLLKSTRDDLQRLFGKPNNPGHPYDPIYYLPDGQLDVEYSRGLCSEIENGTWNVPEFIVTRIFFIPAKPVTPKQLRIRQDGYKKYEIYDFPGAYEYENKAVGISFTLKRNGKIEIIEFHPSNKYDHLFCRK